jgi:hypothetical protein
VSSISIFVRTLLIHLLYTLRVKQVYRGYAAADVDAADPALRLQRDRVVAFR